MRILRVTVTICLALAALACSRGDKSKEAPGAAGSGAPLALPPLPSGDPRAKPVCEAPRACLKGSLPSVFDNSQVQDLEKKALDCLGGTIARAWDLRECLPFTFARESRSGELVQVAMNCGDLCPAYASLVFDLATESTEFECVCRGYFPVRSPGSNGYVGCALPPPNAGQSYFSIVDASADKHVVVQGSPRFVELGFLQYSIIESVDGVAPSGKDALAKLLDGIPRHLPGALRMRRESPAAVKELHYITRGAAEGLAKLSADLGLPGLAGTHSACLNPEGDDVAPRSLVRVSFGGLPVASGVPTYLFRKADCTGEDVRPVLQFEEAVKRAAKEAKPRDVPPGGARSACKQIESIRAFSVTRPGDDLEVRYADWAAW